MEIDGGKCQVGGRTDGRTRRTALPRKKQAALIVIEPATQSVSQSVSLAMQCMMKGAAAEEFFKAKKG